MATLQVSQIRTMTDLLEGRVSANEDSIALPPPHLRPSSNVDLQTFTAQQDLGIQHRRLQAITQQ